MRARDEIWDQLDAHFGPVRTKAERGRRNAAVKQLREAGATPQEIALAYEWCARTFTVFTEMAIVSHFGRAQHEMRPAESTLSVLRRMADDV